MEATLPHERDSQGENLVEKKHRGSMVGGLILVAIGILALLANWMPETFGTTLPILVLGGMGLIFIIAGIATRESGFFIPGGILSGLGFGMSLIIGPFAGTISGNAGGLFLLGFAAGWVLIPILSSIFTDEHHLWALIPGAIIGFVGLAVMYGGAWQTGLEWVGRLWPLALIAGGVYALFRARREREEDVPEEKPIEKHA
jgi:hypothetical protein